MDNAYWLWTFQGRLLQKNSKDRFCQLLWRPRPPTLLSQDQIKVGFPHQLQGRGSDWREEKKVFLPDTVRVIMSEEWRCGFHSRPFEEMQSSENQKEEGSFSRGNRFGL